MMLPVDPATIDQTGHFIFTFHQTQWAIDDNDCLLRNYYWKSCWYANLKFTLNVVIHLERYQLLITLFIPIHSVVKPFQELTRISFHCIFLPVRRRLATGSHSNIISHGRFFLRTLWWQRTTVLPFRPFIRSNVMHDSRFRLSWRRDEAADHQWAWL